VKYLRDQIRNFRNFIRSNRLQIRIKESCAVLYVYCRHVES